MFVFVTIAKDINFPLVMAQSLDCDDSKFIIFSIEPYNVDNNKPVIFLESYLIFKNVISTVIKLLVSAP